MFYEKDFKNLTNVAKEFVSEFLEDENFFLTKKKENNHYSKNENGNLLLAIPMPGLSKENIKVHFEGGLLVVEGKTNTWYTTLEYKNKFRLIDCDENSIKAEFKNGVLELNIKKIEQKKTIKIE